MAIRSATITGWRSGSRTTPCPILIRVVRCVIAAIITSGDGQCEYWR